MCCLFGIHDYGGKLSCKEKAKILSVLSVACEERGTDATGIAYNTGGSLKAYKRPLPAHLLWFRIFENTSVVMGHTRMTTQGSERFNANNHPWSSTAANITFALAHNGVLSNDKRLRRQYNLPATKVFGVNRVGFSTFDTVKIRRDFIETGGRRMRVVQAWRDGKITEKEVLE